MDRPRASACSSSSASRWAAQEDRPGSLDDDRLVAHRGDVRAAGRARAHHEGDLRDARSRHPGLVIEDAPEVIPVGEDVRLERQEGAAAVDHVDAGQSVLEGDLLGAQMLLDRHRVVGAALHRRVVGDDDAGRVLDSGDAGDDPRPGCVVVVQAVRRQRTELQERRTRIDQPVDPLADGQLASLAVSRDRPVVTGRTTPCDGRLPGPELLDQSRHRGAVRARLRGVRVQAAAQYGHARMIGTEGAPERVPRSEGGAAHG
jgi:hypothetical protein